MNIHRVKDGFRSIHKLQINIFHQFLFVSATSNSQTRELELMHLVVSSGVLSLAQRRCSGVDLKSVEVGKYCNGVSYVERRDSISIGVLKRVR